MPSRYTEYTTHVVVSQEVELTYDGTELVTEVLFRVCVHVTPATPHTRWEPGEPGEAEAAEVAVLFNNHHHVTQKSQGLLTVSWDMIEGMFGREFMLWVQAEAERMALEGDGT
jgi:hypothetical protein